jgi:hypothetical protein
MTAKKANTTTQTRARASTKKSVQKPSRRLTRTTLVKLYAARRHLDLSVLKETGLRMPVAVYFKDPDVAKRFEKAGIDEKFTTIWEPGLRDGPTSARFAVVDYDATNNKLTPPAIWDRKKNCYCYPAKTPLKAG